MAPCLYIRRSNRHIDMSLEQTAAAALKLQEIQSPVSAYTAALLERAVALWHEQEFDDNEVKAVKDIFRNVFNIESELQGSPVKDALILESDNKSSDQKQMFALEMKTPGVFRWVRWEIEGDVWINQNNTLEESLHFMGMSAVGRLGRGD